MDCPLLAIVGKYRVCRHQLNKDFAGAHVVSEKACQKCLIRDKPTEPRAVPTEAEIEAALARVSSPKGAPAPCAHRGQKLRDEPCKLCGRKGETEAVYACAVHGECSQRRFKSGTGPACCLGCRDYRAAAVQSRIDQITFGITAFERPRHLERLVASILRFYPEARITVADNGRRKADLPGHIQQLELPYDCGLSAARNALIDACQAPYLLILEEDFLFTADTRIEPLVEILEHDREVGCVGGSLRVTGRPGPQGGDGIRTYAVDYDPFRGTLYARPAARALRKTAGGVEYRYCDKIANFFAGRREFFADHRWRDELKVGEHATYFVDVLRGGKWRVGHTNESIVTHDLSGRSGEYNRHRGRATTMNQESLASLGFPGGYVPDDSICFPACVIPKTFHRVWLGGKPIPAEFIEFGQTWLRLNPGWQLKDWREKEIATLGQLVTGDLWKRAKNFAQASDVLRYELLYRFGGVYLDTDFEALKPLGKLLDSATFVGAGEQPKPMLSAGFIAAVPRHRIIGKAIELLPERMQGDLPQAKATGPGLLTEAWKPHADEPGVIRYGPELFYPYGFNEKHRRHEKFPGAVAAHHWHASWVTSEPWATKPRLYVILMTARTGSSYLCSLLASTKRLGDPSESISPAGRKYAGDPDDGKLLDYIAKTARTPNGVIGLKCHIDEWAPFYESVKDHPLVAGAKYVLLLRGDALRQAISHRRAELTDQWSCSGQPSQISHDELHVADVIGKLVESAGRNTRAIDWCSAHAIRPLRVLYEDLCDDPQATVERIAEFVGVSEVGSVESRLRVQRDEHTERVLEELGG